MNPGNFDLKTFIRKSSNLLLEHLKSLPKSSYRDLDKHVRKKIIVLFLKEYMKHNKGKYSRNQFNAGFVQKFIHQIFPRISPEDIKISSSKVQITLIDFINFLTLHDVLKRKTEEKIREEIRKSQGIAHEDSIHLNQAEFDTIDKNLQESDDFMDKYLNKIDSWVCDMLKSPPKNLKGYPEGLIHFTITNFSEDMLYYLSQTHETWHPDDVEYLYCYIYPRKVNLEEENVKAISPILTSFFTYLGNKGIISKSQENQLKMRLYSISDRILELMNDKSLWSFMKTALWEARESGVDIGDENQMNAFLNIKQLEHNTNIIASIINEEMEKIELFSTDELIQKLDDMGVPFQKEKFLKKVREFYTVEELANHWELKYNIGKSDNYSRYGWMIVKVLWNRLAPDVMYGEKISEIMLQGYNLINEKQFKKACNTWLKTWDYLKQRYVPEIRSISEVDERYNGAVHIYDWILDFSKVLFNQGLRQKQYFEERIQFSTEILEFFPKSDDYLIQNVMRFLGESYFYLGKQKEGEKLFKILIEKFPKYTYGYIAWADFYAGVYKDHIQFDKAKSIYQSALKRCTENLDDVKKRIKQLEERRDGITHLEDLLSEYKSYLSEKNLSKKNKERKISDVRKLLDFIIRVNEMIYPEDMAEKLYPETILDFLGIWAIKEGYVSNQTSMIRLCRSTKSFFRFFQDFMILHEEELKEIREICNSKKFFIKRLEGFQKKNIGKLLSQQRYKKYYEWESGVSKWYHWIKVKEEEAEREAKKVRLSKEKRKLFKDVDEFF